MTPGSSPAVRWTLYSRPECTLCDEMLAELLRLLPAQQAQHIRIIDISTDPLLERRYAIRIPVLLADDEVVCTYRLDAQRVLTFLERAESG